MAADSTYTQTHRRLVETGQWDKYVRFLASSSCWPPTTKLTPRLTTKFKYVLRIYAALIERLNELGWIDDLKHTAKGYVPSYFLSLNNTEKTVRTPNPTTDLFYPFPQQSAQRRLNFEISWQLLRITLDVRTLFHPCPGHHHHYRHHTPPLFFSSVWWVVSHYRYLYLQFITSLTPRSSYFCSPTYIYSIQHIANYRIIPSHMPLLNITKFLLILISALSTNYSSFFFS